MIRPIPIPVPVYTPRERAWDLPWWADLLIIAGVLIATAVITTAIYWWTERRP